MAKQVKILEWNVSTPTKLKTLLVIEKIEICFISETHFTNEFHNRFEGYKVYYFIQPDNARRGEAATTMKETIVEHQEIRYKTKQI